MSSPDDVLTLDLAPSVTNYHTAAQGVAAVAESLGIVNVGLLAPIIRGVVSTLTLVEVSTRKSAGCLPFIHNVYNLESEEKT